MKTVSLGFGEDKWLLVQVTHQVLAVTWPETVRTQELGGQDRKVSKKV